MAFEKNESVGEHSREACDQQLSSILRISKSARTRALVLPMHQPTPVGFRKKAVPNGAY